MSEGPIKREREGRRAPAVHTVHRHDYVSWATGPDPAVVWEVVETDTLVDAVIINTAGKTERVPVGDLVRVERPPRPQAADPGPALFDA